MTAFKVLGVVFLLRLRWGTAIGALAASDAMARTPRCRGEAAAESKPLQFKFGKIQAYEAYSQEV
jgi:hypothetical protein